VTGGLVVIGSAPLGASSELADGSILDARVVEQAAVVIVLWSADGSMWAARPTSAFALSGVTIWSVAGR